MESGRREKRGMNRSGEEQFPRTQSNRTLSDIIRADSRGDSHYYEGKKSWRHFKDKLRRRRGAAWTSTFATPTSDMPINNRSMNRRPSGGFSNDPARSADISAVPDVDPELMSNPRNSGPAMLQRNSSRAIERASGRFEKDDAPRMRRLQREDNSDEEEEDDDDDDHEDGSEEEEGGSDGDEEGEHPVRMSLMSLLAETDKQMGLDGSSYMLGEDDDDEDEDEEERGGGGEYSNCCICMVRHKGTAFVPCGHTFCRLCSREMWVQKGNNCPLCNNYILEILDIF